MSELDDTSQKDVRRKSGEFMRMADELFQSADYDGALRLVLLALDIEPGNPFVIAYRQRIEDAMNAGQETRVPPRDAGAETIVYPGGGPSPTGGGVSEEKQVSRVHEEVARFEAEKMKREETEAEQRALREEESRRVAIAESKRKAEEELRRQTEEEERRKAKEEVRRALDDAHRQVEEERKRSEEEERLRKEAEKKQAEEVEARKQLDAELRRVEEEMESRLHAEREKFAQAAKQSQEEIEASRKANEREVHRIEGEYKKQIEEEKRRLTEEKERVIEEMRVRLEEDRKKFKKILKKQREKQEHRRPESATSPQREPEGDGGEEVMKSLSDKQFRSLVDSMSSFAFGMASVIDILAAPGEARVTIKHLEKKHWGALESNWMAVSEDLRNALLQLEKEAHGKS